MRLGLLAGWMTMGAVALARGAATLGPLPELRLELGAPGVTIVCPASSGYAEVAARLARELGEATGRSPVVVPEADAAGRTGPGPVLVLGNLMDSTLVRRLYYEAYDFTDYAFPGPGGHVLRTIRDPLGWPGPVLLVGGSDVAGVAAAAQSLVARVKRDGRTLGYFVEVKLGTWARADELATARYLADDDAVWQRVGQSGSWDYMDNIARAGVGYLRTGDERYLALFRRELNRFIDQDVFNPNAEAPPMLHGRLYVLVLVWDLVRDHPMFSAADRRKVEEMFLHVARSPEGTEQIVAAAATTAVRYNHHTRAGLDAYFVGRFFARRHALPEAQDWLATAARLFAPQLQSAKPVEDSWGHQWAASLFNTLAYALATGQLDYVNRPAFRQAADRCLIAYGRAAPRHYLSACAVATGDTGYLSLEADLPSLARDAARQQLVPADSTELVTFTDEVLRTFTGRDPIVRRSDLLGLGVAPLDPLWHDTIETPIYNPDGIFTTTVPAADAFDKAALRDGWGKDDFYLLLDGISGGHHAYQDANCLVWLREGGVDWFTPQPGYQHSLGVRWQNGVSLALDGRGSGRMARYARLLHHETVGDLSAVGAEIDDGGGVRWERHLVRRRDDWTLIVDRAISSRAGELLVERFWWPHGEIRTSADGFTSRAETERGPRLLHFVSATGLEDRGAPVERVRRAVSAGDELDLAGLMWTDREPGAGSRTVVRTSKGFQLVDRSGQAITVAITLADGRGRGVLVRSVDGDVQLGQGSAATAPGAQLPRPPTRLPVAVDAPAITLPWRETRLGGERITAVTSGPAGYAVGTASGLVVAFDPALHERWRTQRPRAVRALELSGAEVVVGDEDGSVTLMGGDGAERWSRPIPWVTLPWAYWGEERSRVRELAVADLDGDGVDEILVSNADRRVYAFDHLGRERWRRPIEWGVYTAMWPGVDHGKFALAGGTSRPSIHGWCVLLGADGTVMGHRQRPDLTCWSIPSSHRDLQWVDLDGDGTPELVSALETNCRQLVAYGADGTLKWDLDVAGPASALAFDPVRRRILCASAAGYVVSVDGPTGRRQWCTWVGEEATLAWWLPDGRAAIVPANGRVLVLSAEGELAGAVELGEAVTAVPRPGNHRGPGRRLILGTAQGRVLVLP